ncbi:MAG TPA: GGDEF domain-containing protein [Gaiellaceae bacterium]|nr:GGDEF domain-containing protein [Gaiellaceae bacterium]
MTTIMFSAVLAAGSRQDLYFVLAVVATLATLALLFVTLRTEVRNRGEHRGRRDRRGRTAARDPREALAIVGDTLAATHNPEALLPVILRATVDATGAAGGRLLVGEGETAAVGNLPADVEPLQLELAALGESRTTMLLYPPAAGFDAESGRLAAWLASQAAIALENAHLHHAVQRQAVTDELTGLVNRRRFMTALESEIARASRIVPAALILADLDDFKLVNDAFGHPIGDELLQSFALAMLECVRDFDVPARLGGEEFAVLLPETPLAGAVAVAERLQRLLTRSPLLERDGRSIRATASFGVAELVEGETAYELLRRADAALYRAKAEGKNTVVAAKAAAAA